MGERIGIQFLPESHGRRGERDPRGHGKRQHFPALAAILTLGIFFAALAPAAAGASESATRRAADWIEFSNTHTGETLRITFRDEKGEIIPGALQQLNRICGDHRSREHREMDPALFILLADLAAAAQTDPHFEIISAFRSSRTNEKLRSNGGGQAKKSQHIEGKAMDVRLKGVTPERLRDLARALNRGGVGYYPAPNPQAAFVHIDTSRPRYWEG